MDFRLSGKPLQQFMERENLTDDTDLLSVAGSAKQIVDSETRELILKQIGISYTLHGMRGVHLMNHTDCGAYGGRKAFESDEKELEKLTSDLHEAKRLLNDRWPDVDVHLWMAFLTPSEEMWDVRTEKVF